MRQIGESDYSLLIEAAGNLEGPHEWGYRDLADGTFISDCAPFAAAASLRSYAQDLSRIDAADDLLEALKTAMQWINAWDVGFLFDDEWAEDERKINAAIAKAGAKP